MLDVEHDFIALPEHLRDFSIISAQQSPKPCIDSSQEGSGKLPNSPETEAAGHQTLQVAFLARFILAWCSFLCKQHVGLECVSASTSTVTRVQGPAVWHLH